MSISQRMRDTNSELWEACFAHPFVQGIGHGDLDDQAFKRFLVQDYLFLIDYARVLAFGSAKAHDLETQTWFAKLLDATLSIEMDLHRRVCREWGIAPSDLASAQPLPTTVAYTSYLVRTAAGGDLGDLAASLLPCQWGYADIGLRLKAQGVPDHAPRYAAWVESYADPGYVELTDWLRRFVDRLGEGTDDTTFFRWRKIFRTTLRFELAFWEMAWTGEDWLA